MKTGHSDKAGTMSDMKTLRSILMFQFLIFTTTSIKVIMSYYYYFSIALFSKLTGTINTPTTHFT